MIKEFASLDRRDRDRLVSVKKIADKLDKICKVREDETISLGPNERGTILLCYFSIRKFRDSTQEDN